MTATANPFAPVTVPDFLAVFKEFAGIDESALQFQLDLSNMKQNKQAWDRYWRFAVMLESAHELAVLYDVSGAAEENGKNDPKGVGYTTSVSASPSSLSQSESIPAWMTGDDAVDSYYGRTLYGQRYLALMNQVISPAGVVISPQISAQAALGRGYRSLTS